MATEMTMAVVERASAAYESSHFGYGRTVELVGLKKEQANMNGKRGIVQGYQWQSKRRTVHVLDDHESIDVKPKNMRLIGEEGDEAQEKQGSAAAKERVLCNLQCRLGTTSLQEAIMGNRLDVAKLLVEKLGADIDIADGDGVSPRSMCCSTFMPEKVNPVITYVKEVATKKGRAVIRAARRKCAQCGKPEPAGNNFSQCSRCKQIRYCSRECQGKSSRSAFRPRSHIQSFEETHTAAPF